MPFFLARNAGAPCPGFYSGTEKILGKGSLRMTSRPIANVVFHPPIDPADFPTREELTQAVRPAVASGLPEWMRT